MNTNQYIVGIDPDIEKNGYAILDMETRKVSVTTVTLPDLLEQITSLQSSANEEGKRLTVVVEAGWLRESNWHLKFSDTKAYAAKLGHDVGRNHQRGMDICELLAYKGINVVQYAPLQKIWRGKDYKITHDELVNIVGPIKHTNQEGRDAVLIAWHYAALPIRFTKH